MSQARGVTATFTNNPPDAVNDALSSLAAAHTRRGSAHYYHVRDFLFNPLREACRTADGRIAYTPIHPGFAGEIDLSVIPPTTAPA